MEAEKSTLFVPSDPDALDIESASPKFHVGGSPGPRKLVQLAVDKWLRSSFHQSKEIIKNQLRKIDAYMPEGFRPSFLRNKTREYAQSFREVVNSSKESSEKIQKSKPVGQNSTVSGRALQTELFQSKSTQATQVAQGNVGIIPPQTMLNSARSMRRSVEFDNKSHDRSLDRGR